MSELNIAVDGGKDSLSMAARVKNETIKSPGTLVISTYAPCPDVTVRVTPDLKSPGMKKVGELVWVNIEGKLRLGGSALAQSFGQQGNDTPDVKNSRALKKAFEVTQNLLKNKKILAGHDISDGGLLVCLLEMAIGGMCGLQVNIPVSSLEVAEGTDATLAALYAEECGWVIECSAENLQEVVASFKAVNVTAFHVGTSKDFGMNSKITITNGSSTHIDTTVLAVTKMWERTSFELEKLQMNPECAEEEFKSLDTRTGPKYQLTFNPDDAVKLLKTIVSPWKVAVIREEGINGDREMIAALMKANFEVHDVTMSDLLARRTFLDNVSKRVFNGFLKFEVSNRSFNFENLMIFDILVFKEYKSVYSL
jgi:phosphoribosylformylglycinamidine synthase